MSQENQVSVRQLAIAQGQPLEALFSLFQYFSDIIIFPSSYNLDVDSIPLTNNNTFLKGEMLFIFNQKTNIISLRLLTGAEIWLLPSFYLFESFRFVLLLDSFSSPTTTRTTTTSSSLKSKKSMTLGRGVHCRYRPRSF